MKRIVLIAGFESFNANLYRQAAQMATARCQKLEIIVFSDLKYISTGNNYFYLIRDLYPNPAPKPPPNIINILMIS